MSGLISELVSSKGFVPLAVLVASFMGSAHCVAMCGGLVAATTRTTGDLFRYHLGRLVGYLALGVLAGALGKHVFLESALVLPWVAAILMGVSLIFVGIRVWNGQTLHFSFFPVSVFKRLYAGSQGSAFKIGGLSAFLPCGWLHTFVLGAVATQSPLLGGLFLFSFWLGTLPAMLLAPGLFQKIIGPLTLKMPKLSAILLVAAGVICMSAKLATLPEALGHAEHSVSCHPPAHP